MSSTPPKSAEETLGGRLRLADILFVSCADNLNFTIWLLAHGYLYPYPFEPHQFNMFVNVAKTGSLSTYLLIAAEETAVILNTSYC